MMHDRIHTMDCHCRICGAAWREEVRGDAVCLIVGAAGGTLISLILIVAKFWRPILTFFGL